MSTHTSASLSESLHPDLNPIRDLRVHTHISQAQLASLLGVTEQTIRRAEQGTFNFLPPAFDLSKLKGYSFGHGYSFGPANLASAASPDDSVRADYYFTDIPKLTHEELSQRYEEWRIARRNYLKNHRIIPDLSAILWYTPHMEQPLYTLRKMTMALAKEEGIIRSSIKSDSMAGFAKLVAIDPASYTEAEASYSAPHEGHVFNLLRDLGFDRGEITHFRRVRD